MKRSLNELQFDIKLKTLVYEAHSFNLQFMKQPMFWNAMTETKYIRDKTTGITIYIVLSHLIRTYIKHLVWWNNFIYLLLGTDPYFWRFITFMTTLWHCCTWLFNNNMYLKYVIQPTREKCNLVSIRKIDFMFEKFYLMTKYYYFYPPKVKKIP